MLKTKICYLDPLFGDDISAETPTQASGNSFRLINCFSASLILEKVHNLVLGYLQEVAFWLDTRNKVKGIINKFMLHAVLKLRISTINDSCIAFTLKVGSNEAQRFLYLTLLK